MQALKDVTGRLVECCGEHHCFLDQNVVKVEDLVSDLAAEVAYQWASGADLDTVCGLDEKNFEGSIVRMLRRLITALQQLQEAAENWGSGKISQLCADAIVAVNRGIVKADSLYIVEDQEEGAQK